MWDWRLWILLVLKVASAAKNNDDNQYKTAYACEGAHIELVCGHGQLIQLVRANYGRFSISICNEQGILDWSVDCASGRSYNVIYNECSLKSNCSILSSSLLFDDPCPGTHKYLEAHYQCVAESTSTSAPFTTSSTSTSTTRPPIIIPVTRFLRPSPPSVPSSPTPEPLPSAVSSTTITFSTTSSSSSTTTTTTSTTTTTTTSAPPPPPVHDFRATATTEEDLPLEAFCKSSHARSLLWNWTRAGDEVIQRCPSGTAGMSRWRCSPSIPPRWEPPYPDLSQCTSYWLTNLADKLAGGRSVTKTAEELVHYARTKPLYGGDVIRMAELIHSMAAKMADIVQDGRHGGLLEEFLELVVALHGALTEAPERNHWKDLPPGEARKMAGILVRGVERAGWLLAAHQPGGYERTRGAPGCLVAVRVLEPWRRAEQRFASGLGDRMELPAAVLDETAAGGPARLVLTAFRHLDLLLPPANSSLRLNSRVLGVWVDGFHMVRLRAPLTVVFRHIQVENVSNPQCVYWDIKVRSWRNQGCKLQATNRTHSTCVCHLLTNFALTMELSPGKPEAEETFVLRIVTFIGCALCILLTLVTLIVLQLYKCVQSQRVTVHKHVCLCLVASEALVAASGSGWHCPWGAGLTAYFALATFAWLALGCVQLRAMLAGRPSLRLLLAGGLAYLLPAAALGLAAIGDPPRLAAALCRPRLGDRRLLVVLGPAAVAAAVSLLFLLMTLVKICCSESSHKCKDQTKLTSISLEESSGHCKKKFMLWSVESLTILVVLILTWTFCLIHTAQGSAPAAYLYAVFNTLLGLLVLCLFCLKNDKVCRAVQKSVHRLEWLPACVSPEPPPPPGIYGAPPPPTAAVNGVVDPPTGVVGPPPQWNTIKTQLPTISGQGLYGIRRGEEHPLHSLCQTWRGPPDPHIYESIEDGLYRGRPATLDRIFHRDSSLYTPAS